MWCLLLAHRTCPGLTQAKLSKDFRAETLPIYYSSHYLMLTTTSHNLLDWRHLRGKFLEYLAVTTVVVIIIIITLIISDNSLSRIASLIFSLDFLSTYLPIYQLTYLFCLFFCQSSIISLAYIALHTYRFNISKDKCLLFYRLASLTP